LKSCCVLQDHYDDERDKIILHKTTADLQDQDQDRYFWSQTGLVLRPTVSDHITAEDKFTAILYTPCTRTRRAHRGIGFRIDSVCE